MKAIAFATCALMTIGTGCASTTEAPSNLLATYHSKCLWLVAGSLEDSFKLCFVTLADLNWWTNGPPCVKGNVMLGGFGTTDRTYAVTLDSENLGTSIDVKITLLDLGFAVVLECDTHVERLTTHGWVSVPGSGKTECELINALGSRLGWRNQKVTVDSDLPAEILYFKKPGDPFCDFQDIVIADLAKHHPAWKVTAVTPDQTELWKKHDVTATPTLVVLKANGGAAKILCGLSFVEGLEGAIRSSQQRSTNVKETNSRTK